MKPTSLMVQVLFYNGLQDMYSVKSNYILIQQMTKRTLLLEEVKEFMVIVFSFHLTNIPRLHVSKAMTCEKMSWNNSCSCTS